MTPPERLVLATSNKNKVTELRQLLGDRYEIEGRPQDLAETVEDGDTLEYNSLKKAGDVVAQVGALAVADDTGLFVDALDGRPGVWTARYAGPDATSLDNVRKLLAELGTYPNPAQRTARFRTVIAAVWPSGEELVVEGVVDGRIGAAPKGEAGFGYDPVFIPHEGDGRTFAEMSADEKNGISHRGRAVAALLERL